MLTELEDEARSSGSFVDCAIVREIKIAAGRFSDTDLMWSEVMILARRWKEGMPDIMVLDAVRRINRVTSCWKTETVPAGFVTHNESGPEILAGEGFQ